MTDNLEQLERNWPPRRPKDISTVKFFMAFAILFTVLDALYVVLHIIDARRHHADFWYLGAFNLTFGILLPWAAAIGAYRRVRATVVTLGASSDVLLAIRQQGTTALYAVYMAMMLVLMATLFIGR